MIDDRRPTGRLELAIHSPPAIHLAGAYPSYAYHQYGAYNVRTHNMRYHVSYPHCHGVLPAILSV